MSKVMKSFNTDVVRRFGWHSAALLSGMLVICTVRSVSVQAAAIAGNDDSAPVLSRPVGQLWIGESLGNLNTYVTLTPTTDLVDASSPGGLAHEFHESTNQRDYALTWTVDISSSSGEHATPINTQFHPAYQQTSYRLGSGEVSKAFFVPFETEFARQGHFLLERGPGVIGAIHVRSELELPAGTTIEQQQFNGVTYAALRYEGGGRAILWGAANAEVKVQKLATGAVRLTTTYQWTAGQPFPLSFAYWPAEVGGLGNDPIQLLLSTLFEPSGPGVPVGQTYLARIRKLLVESEGAMRRYVNTARLITPDVAINSANDWAKVNMLRVNEQYRWGDAFTNGPPADVVVARDSALYLLGSSYFEQDFSRRLLELWFKYGEEPSGKFNEYMKASGEPLFTDDYGMNINDDTPLVLLAAKQYYSLTGDRGFLQDVYPGILRSAAWIESQRAVGANNRYGLLWCTSTAIGTPGLFTWRNIVQTNISGAVTETNSEASAALGAVGEIAGAMGDPANEQRFRAAAQSLRDAINLHLRPQEDRKSLYYLNINPAGEIVRQVTGDEVFPVLYGVAAPETATSILAELFSDRFFVTEPGGAGGFHTVSSAESTYRRNRPTTLAFQPGVNDDFGLMGGVWGVVGSWVGHAAALSDRPDMALKALRASALLADMPNPRASYTVPGEFGDGYYNDSLQRQPWSSPVQGPWVAGTFVYSSLESFIGILPQPTGLRIHPELPTSWEWVGASDIPYHGAPLTLLAVRRSNTLYATAPVSTDWNLVTVPAALQDRFDVEPKGGAFAVVVPGHGNDLQFIIVSAPGADVKVIDRLTKQEVLRLQIPAGGIVTKTIATG